VNPAEHIHCCIALLFDDTLRSEHSGHSSWSIPRGINISITPCVSRCWLQFISSPSELPLAVSSDTSGHILIHNAVEMQLESTSAPTRNPPDADISTGLGGAGCQIQPIYALSATVAFTPNAVCGYRTRKLCDEIPFFDLSRDQKR